MLLHKWTMQDKDADIIIIKSEQHHMVRERKQLINNQIESLLVKER